MEWVDLAVWIIVVVLAALIARGALDMPALGLQALAGVAGLVLCILFLTTGGAVGFAWAATGVGAVGILALTAGVVWLMSDRRAPGHHGEQADEVEAGLAGVLLPMFGLATAFALMMAFDIATVAS